MLPPPLCCACGWTGDKPELLYPEAAAELAGMGHASTLDYVAAAAAAVMRETGLLPHINAGEGERETERVRGPQSAMAASMWSRPLLPLHYCPRA